MTKIAIIILVLVVLGFGYYTLSPLFIVEHVDDQLPENIIEIDETGGMVKDLEGNIITDAHLTREEKLEEKRQMEEANNEPVVVMEEEMPEMKKNTSPKPSPAKSFPVFGTSGHPAGGVVKVLETTAGTVIRYENFSTINGPRLNVYLANDLAANDYVDLGPIKGTEGNINYEIPDNIDVSQWKYVMYWCVPFGVLFNYAEIN